MLKMSFACQLYQWFAMLLRLISVTSLCWPVNETWSSWKNLDHRYDITDVGAFNVFYHIKTIPERNSLMLKTEKNC